MKLSPLKSGMALRFLLNGIVIAIPQEIYTQILKHFQLVNISSFEASSMLYMKKPSWGLGVLALPCIDILGSAIFYYLIQIIGRDDLVLKSVFYSMVVNSVLFQVFGTIVGNPYVIQNAIGNYVFASSSALAGFIGGFYVQKYILPYE